MNSPLVAPFVDQALCAQTDPTIFFPEHTGDVNGIRAKKICAICDVRTECLTWALEHDEQFGIYGGTTPAERRRLTRALRATA